MVWQGILFLTKMAIKHIQNVVISVRNMYENMVKLEVTVMSLCKVIEF